MARSSGEPDLTMSANELASVLVGGVRLRTLHAAGLVRGATDAVDALDRSFASTASPYLSIWY